MQNVSSQAHAQVSPITSSGLGTQVSAPINLPGATVQHNITGGMRPGNGVNLFHSFGEFGVPASNIANFLNETALPTSNILGRVTGGNPSNIFGTLQTTGFGSANLFLMNPAGIVFGPNASLNVGGSVNFTTADYLRLADGARFNAITGPQDASISSAPVAAFGFLGSNPGAVTVQGSQLAVSEGQAISLVGGNIDVVASTLENGASQPALIAAPKGQINLVSVASAGEVLYPSLESSPNIGGASFTNMGSIALSQGALLDVSSNAAGTVKIRAGQLLIENGSISADTAGTNGASIAVDIALSGDLSIVADTNPAITARTTSSGDAGEVQISSANFEVTANPENILAVIDTHTTGTGRAGNVTIRTGDLQVMGDPLSNTFFIDSGTIGPDSGHGGNVAITASGITMENPIISTGNLRGQLFGENSTGSAGNIAISADNIDLVLSRLDAGGFSLEDSTGSIGRAGDIAIIARNVQLTDTSFVAQGFERGGAITVDAERLVMRGSDFITQTNLLPGGGVTISANIVELTQGSQLVSNTGGDGDSGSIRVTASDHFSLLEGIDNFRPTSITTTSVGTYGSGLGQAGDVFITTPRLEMTIGARVNTATQSSGRGGNVTVNATDSISISGEFSDPIPEPLFNLGDVHASGIFTSTIGETCSGSCGDAGRVSISTGSLTMNNGAQINSGTSNSGQGGNITVNARDTISINGTLSNGQPAGILSRTIGTAPDSGTGGNISLAAGQSVSLINGAAISASSTGPADAGNIAINGGAQFVSNSASVTTEASQASGGNIVIQATDAIRLVNSQLSTSVQGGPNTAGGNILLDPALVTIQNSQVTAQAVQGAGGNINIIAGTFLADSTSVISASSQFGLSGSVNIQSPLSSLSNTLATLTQRPLQAQNLLRQRCAAQVNGQLSSLVVSGRDALPAEPGGWLMSPLAWMAEDEPAPQAQVASKPVFDPIGQRQRRSGQSSDQREYLSQRGVWDRETGCGS